MLARGLGKRYGRVAALAEVSLEIPRGTIVGVLGPSGAGKTTLVRCVGLLARPTEGSLRVLGADAGSADGALRARIGYMPQEAALYEELPARANVRYFGRGVPDDRVDRLLALLGLADRAGDPVLGFSGGMKQRVSLACALARDPELLLLDEPTAGIDPILRVEFWKEFRRLRDEGRTLLVSTHQIDEAVHCDRLLVIREGRVLWEGPPADLLARGGASATARTRAGAVHERRFEDPARGMPPWIAGIGAGEIVELRVRPDTLEDVLVRLIGERSDPGAGGRSSASLDRTAPGG